MHNRGEAFQDLAVFVTATIYFPVKFPVESYRYAFYSLHLTCGPVLLPSIDSTFGLTLSWDNAAPPLHF